MFEDDVRIPPPGYRSAPQRRAAETRRTMMIVAGAGVFVVLCILGYFVATSSSGPDTVPVIEASNTPLKVKPVDPGGLNVNTQTSALLAGSGSGNANVAPAPEAPDPAGLAAAAQQPAAPSSTAAPAPTASSAAATPSASAMPSSTAPAATAPTQAPAVAVRSVPETPAASAPKQTAMNVPPPSKSAAQVHNLAQEYATPSGKAGHIRVQLAALESQEAAVKEWQHLSRKMPSLFSGRRPIFVQAQVNGRTYWRVRTAGFASVSEANQFCQDVHAHGGACTVASF